MSNKKKNKPISKQKFLVIGILLIIFVKLGLGSFYSTDYNSDEVEALSNLGENIKAISDEIKDRGDVVSDVSVNEIIEHVITGDPKKDVSKIAIVIDDLGINVKMTNAIIDIDVPMTLAFLPYAKNLDDFVQRSIDNGHEVIIHTPMQPVSTKTDPGPVYLKAGMSDKDFNEAIDIMFNSFSGYVGINNHMGSKATQDKELMSKLMPILKERDLYFLDSRTIGNSIAEDTAHEYGVRSISRDVFLDHENDDEFIQDALARTRSIANNGGLAIAIGHPKETTVRNLVSWIDQIKIEQNFKFVTVGSVLPK